MPSRHPHDAIIDIFRAHRHLIPALDILTPEITETGRIDDSNLSQLAPIALAADLVWVFGSPPQLALAFEVQFRRDPRKRRTWPLYATALAHRLDCDATIVVIAPTKGVENWANTAINFALGTGSLKPIVIGPSNIPRITDEAIATTMPEMTLLSAVIHGRARGANDALLAILPVLEGLPIEQGISYYEAVAQSLPKSRQIELEKAMSKRKPAYPFKSLFAQRHYTEGLQEGQQLGRQEGRQLGRQEGQQQGRQEGTSRLLMRQLARRLGLLGPSLQAQVEGLDIARLEALGEALLDFTAVADLEAWLDRHRG